MSEITFEELKNGIALSDIEMAVVRTATQGYIIKTASQATLKPRLSGGEEKELRKGNTILAQYNTDDIVKGYDLELYDVLIHPKVMALVDGGVATFASGSGGAFEGYAAPVLGAPVERTEVAIDLYMANRSTGGDITNYLKVTLENCKGKPVEMDFKDGEFFSPKYTLRSTPSFGSGPMTMETVTELPSAPSA